MRPDSLSVSRIPTGCCNTVTVLIQFFKGQHLVLAFPIGTSALGKSDSELIRSRLCGSLEEPTDVVLDVDSFSLSIRE